MSGITTLFGGMSFFLLLVATILMIASDCSSPTSTQVYFLKTTLSANLARQVIEYLPESIVVFDRLDVRMGLLGYCINEFCTNFHLGYRVPAFLVGGPLGADLLNRETTTALVINPLYTAFSSACLLGFFVTIFVPHAMALFGLLIINTLLGLICLIIDLNIFVKAYYIVRDSQNGFYDAVSVHYGNSLWLMVAAVILTIFSTLLFAATLGSEDRSDSFKMKRKARNGEI
ncbi:hypothetical protein O181_016408 [Austropuccinia psidii MF-1]|uniref:Uncharacterized protein n=1 Tax=Austropuccinia psidii MF-1 TaxID=1389203 RepID=A0A9Q3GQU3_9BASI|nr:hypothetical protein [Austropuccinia psidii MF-1]